MALINSSHKSWGRLVWQRTLDIFTRYFYISQMTTDHAVTHEPPVSSVVDSVGHRWLAPVRSALLSTAAVHQSVRDTTFTSTSEVWPTQSMTLRNSVVVESNKQQICKTVYVPTRAQQLLRWVIVSKSGRGLLFPFPWHPHLTQCRLDWGLPLC